MLTRIYLDTARLGLMSESAQQTYINFVRFVGEEAACLYFEEFLTRGAVHLPRSLQARFPALQTWKGLAHLKSQLRNLVDAPHDSHVLVASRSRRLMRWAAELFGAVASAC